MKYAIIVLNMEEDVNTIITLSKDMIGATDETVIDKMCIRDRGILNIRLTDCSIRN